jgi:hypothetical protein
MKNLFRIALCMIPGVLALFPVASGAQSLYITPPRQHIANRPWNGVETLTLSLMVDSGIASAVAWGTTITLPDTSTLQFVQDFGGAGQPFRPADPFFDTNLSDPYAANSGTLALTFANFTPGATLGNNGLVTLGQFQVRVLKEPNYPNDIPFGGRITLDSILGAPPFGSGVFDELGNNLILGAYGAAITSRPPTPEPAAWLTMGSGIAMGLLCLRRRGRRRTA